MSGNAAAEFSDVLRRIRAAAQGSAVLAAAAAAGRAGETATKMALQVSTHTAGTPTPSAPGEPPAKVSGDLARSIQRTPPVSAGAGVASVTYGSVLIYATVQEFGATIRSKGPWPLRNKDTGQVFGRQVTLQPRPFMRPMAVKLTESPLWAEQVGKAFQAALLK